MKNDLIIVDEFLADLHISMIVYDKDLASIANLQLLVASLRFWLIRAKKRGLEDIGSHVVSRVADFYGDQFQNHQNVLEKARKFWKTFMETKTAES